MSDVIDRIVRNLSQDVIQHLNELPLKVGSEKDLETVQMFGRIDEIKTWQLRDEIQARLRHEREQIALYKKLAKEAGQEIDFTVQLGEKLVPVCQFKEIETKLDSYKKVVKRYSNVPDFDVNLLQDSHTELVKRKEKISILEKKLEKYAGLPPNVHDARDAIKQLEQEIETLEDAAESSLNADIAKYYN